MCGIMVDIQSATAEIRRGKKKKNKLQDKNIMSASATQGGHKNDFRGIVLPFSSYNYTNTMHQKIRPKEQTG